ncbi:MAG: quinone oxidoreductase [Betaproteobacteria bacterium]|nr:quinone oxidoreductase [Betaproteobacteria bacterium]
MRTQAIQITAFGGPEVLKATDIEIGEPAQGEVRVRHQSVAVNFVDVYHRIGQLHGDGPKPPFIAGVQANGVIEALGEGLAESDLRVGDRVTYANIGIGSYVGHRNLPADRLVKIPEALSDEIVAASYLRGLTAHYLLKRLYKVQAGDTVLIHAAAGGVGQLMVQWAKALGAIVIGTVSNEEKAALVQRLGCDYPIVYTKENFADRVLQIFKESLRCTRPMGIAINYGTASGQVEPFPLQDLHSKSLSVCRPTLRTWIAKRSDLLRASHELFDLLSSGRLRIDIAAHVPLHDAAQAHRLIEDRRTAGAIILDP